MRVLPAFRSAIRHRRMVVVLVVVGLATAAATPAALVPAGPPTPVASIEVHAISSGPSIFSTAQHRCQSPESAAWGYRMEPHVAVNPQDPRNLVAVWRQDQWGGALVDGEGGGALSDVSAYSTDAGKTWHEVVLPGLGVCGGGNNEGASDPTVSFGPDGIAYASVVQFGGLTDGAAPRVSDSALGNIMTILVYWSDDGGRTWDGPVTAAAGDSFNDRPAIIADPAVPQRVRLVWMNRFGASDALCVCQALVTARSDDGGRTWSEPTVIDRRNGFASTPAQLTVLPNGELVALFAELLLRPRDSGTAVASIFAARSEDGGRIWSRHMVADYLLSDPSGQDPDSSNTIDAPEFFIEQATGPDGAIYVAWHHNTSIAEGEVSTARSDDGGVTWTEPLTVARVGGQVLNPKIAVADDGTVGVIWADLRNDDPVPNEPDDDELTTDWWVATSRDKGRTWTHTHLSGPFDLRNALFVRGNEERDRGSHYWLGDYYGLASMPQGFSAVFVQPREPEDNVSQTDVLFGRIRLRGHGSEPSHRPAP